MLSLEEQGILKSKGINPDLVDSADLTPDVMMIKMKNGDVHRLTEVWSRVMGYFRPFQDFNVGKKSEFKERKYFSESKAQFYSEPECPCALAAE